MKAAYESLFVWKDLDGGVESSYAMALPEERARPFGDPWSDAGYEYDGFVRPSKKS